MHQKVAAFMKTGQEIPNDVLLNLQTMLKSVPFFNQIQQVYRNEMVKFMVPINIAENKLFITPEDEIVDM